MKHPVLKTAFAAAVMALTLPASARAASLTGIEATPTIRTISGETYQFIPIASSTTGSTDNPNAKATITLTFDSPVDVQVDVIPGAGSASAVTLPASAYTKGPDDAEQVTFSLTRSTPVQLQDLKNTLKVKFRESTSTGAYSEAGTEGTFTLYVDTVVPNAPGGVSADGADNVLLVTWDAPSKTSDIEVITNYIVTYSDTDMSTLSEEEAAKLPTKTVEAVGDLSTTIDGVENGKTYYVTVRSEDWVGNVSPFPKNESGGILTASAEPVVTLTLAELAGEKGGCFIATAAYGSYQEPHVQLLRDFRDRILLPTSLGAKFVDWYYRTSPAYALWIAKHDPARAVARVFLLPLYGLAYLFLHPLLALLAGLLLLGAGAARFALQREVAR